MLAKRDEKLARSGEYLNGLSLRLFFIFVRMNSLRKTLQRFVCLIAFLKVSAHIFGTDCPCRKLRLKRKRAAVKRYTMECPWGKEKVLISIIDEIDCVLARHYGFTEEELDFIINYDIKYRMGREEKDEG